PKSPRTVHRSGPAKSVEQSRTRSPASGPSAMENGSGVNDGTIFEAAGLRLLDPPAGPWGGHPGTPRPQARVRAREPAGWACVLVTWISPGLAGRRGERHDHRTVHERGLVLSDELPMREYRDVDDPEGRPVLFREGHFYDRAPGSVHGLDWEA